MDGDSCVTSEMAFLACHAGLTDKLPREALRLLVFIITSDQLQGDKGLVGNPEMEDRPLSQL
jgi:hypothetical protein